ncbi:MAG: hypothetical protein Q9203_007338 [Teloschistes exilis]
MSSVQTLSSVDDAPAASSALAPVRMPVNLASDDDVCLPSSSVFLSTANDGDMFNMSSVQDVSFLVDSTDSPIVVVMSSHSPPPVQLAANLTADPGKPTSSTTATFPPPVNATRYPGSLDYLWWCLLRMTAGLITLLVNWVYLCQDALTRHHVLPPSQPVMVFKRRAAGHPDGKQLLALDIHGSIPRIELSCGSSFALFSCGIPLGFSGGFSCGVPCSLSCGVPCGPSLALSSRGVSCGVSRGFSRGFSDGLSSGIPCGVSPCGVFSSISGSISSGLSRGFALLPILHLSVPLCPGIADPLLATASHTDVAKGCLALGQDRDSLVASASLTDNAKGSVAPSQDSDPANQPHPCVGHSHHGITSPSKYDAVEITLWLPGKWAFALAINVDADGICGQVSNAWEEERPAVSWVEDYRW